VSVHLQAADGRERKVNAWNWGVLHHIVEAMGLFDDELWAPARGGGAELDAAQCATLVGFLRDELLPRIPPGHRMFFNTTVTDVPDDGTFYRDKDELWKNYSLHHEVLVAIIELLDGATGMSIL
jgi:hypothetical protein